MAFKDLLLQISCYPERSHDHVIENAVAFAAALKAELTALTFEYEMSVPYSPMGGMVLDVGGMVAAETQRSVANANEALKVFNAAALKAGVPHSQMLERTASGLVDQAVANHARLRDLTLIPAGGPGDFQQFIAEKVIFESGRPVVMLPQPETRGPAKRPVQTLDCIAIAWDFSRPAARAIADAMPLLKQAKVVRVITVTNEKTLSTNRSLSDLKRHLGLHGIEFFDDEEDAAGRTIGDTLLQYSENFGLDLLVMGAYGHSRFRDFFLGGATTTMTANPTLPVFLSH